MGGRSIARLALLTAGAIAIGSVTAPTAYAKDEDATVNSATFVGGTGTTVVGGKLYAKQGVPLTLNVTTSSNTRCVDVKGAATLPRQSSSTAKTSWTFATTALPGDGSKGFTVSASADTSSGGGSGCSGHTESRQASYTVDNSGPDVSAALSPAANAAGWNKSDVTVRWTAAEAGSGVAAAQPFQTDAVTTNGIHLKTAPAQSDRLGNAGAAGSVTVRLDKVAPSIVAAQTKNPDGTTTITFTCLDGPGGGEASGIATCLAAGSSTNAKTVQPGVTVNGTATDKAGNTATATSTAPARDTTAPSLDGTPTTEPNGNGWYDDDVVIDWTASDPESDIVQQPADTTISGEGTDLTSSTTVTNGAGLSTTATSRPAVRIDRTAPTTAFSGTANDWVNGDVTVELATSDNLSGVAKTEYTVDGGAPESGTSFALSTEGEHTVSFFSTDKAGNAEEVQTAKVRIDKTAPTIGHAFTPLSYSDGAWTNADVTVTFDCADQGGSGLASCSDPVTKTTEGASQDVVGTAKDTAGNTATDTATVSIDKTDPTITAELDGSKNAAGWYSDDVTVTYTASDELSGVAETPDADTLGEGENQSASAAVLDAAGNRRSVEVSGIDVDKTEPVLTGTFSSGWHTDDVTVEWSCTDALSGPASQPADTVVGGEGNNLSATASCTDVAGNSVTKTVTGIQIDRTDPTTTAEVAEPLASGWYGDAVEVTLTGSDNLSEVVSTSYAVDGGPAKTYTEPFSVSADGEHVITYWSMDGAGHEETAGAPLTLRIDTTAPVTEVLNPMSPDSGWFVTSGIPFAFTATDAGSGIAATYYTIDGGERQTYGEPFTADLSTGTHTISYWSVDLADNDEARQTTKTIQVKVDTIAPTITGTRSPAANGFGWNNSNVEVRFACSDGDSGVDGIAGCGPDTTVANEGAEQSVQGDAQDIAGNKSSTVVDKISIDKTSPSLVGTPTGDANGGEWYRSNVSVAWVGDDALSGIDPATQPVNSAITAEGRGLGATASIADKAGNSTTSSVTGINIDKTAPSITGTLPAGRNAAGWYRGDVVVGFACSDAALADGSAGSGVASCPADGLVSGDGANQSVTSGTGADVAGNLAAATTVGGINIDGQQPQTTVDNVCTATNGFCTGKTATVLLTSTDAGPSGVKEVRYSINGGSELVAAGATTSFSVPLSGTGTATVKYYAVDVAGNAEPTTSATLKYDNIAPTVTHTVNPKANAAGWNRSNVTVHFNATDTDPASGVVPGSVTPDKVITTETTASGVVVTGSAKDTAGNVGSDSVTVKLDKTAPKITGSVVSGTRGTNGWYVGPVAVKYTCTDALSGVAVCPDENVLLSNNGAGQSVTRTATDKADNTATSTVGGISIDSVKPSVTGVNVSGQTYTLGAVPAATCSATDSFSGLLSCKVSVTGGVSGVGTFTWTATAVDKAGNLSTRTGTYRVVYRFDGFLQPITDTAHQIGFRTSVFKAGSTIPVRFQLKNAAGAKVQAASAPLWLAPVRGSVMCMPVDKSAATTSGDTATTYRYDSVAGQYAYNWKTGTGGHFWRIGVKLADGQTHYVYIGLR